MTDQTMALTRYDAAKQALAEVHRIDEVKDIADKAAAMQLYAKQAKDGDLIAHATEIRKRAERRLGELMEDERKAGRLATGKEGKRKALGSPKDPSDRPSLAEQGVDKHLADRARKAAAMSEDKFEAQVAQAVKVAVAATEGDREVVKAARAEQQAEKRERRRQRERDLGAKIPKPTPAVTEQPSSPPPAKPEAPRAPPKPARDLHVGELNATLMSFNATFEPELKAWLKTGPTEEALQMMHGSISTVGRSLSVMSTHVWHAITLVLASQRTEADNAQAADAPAVSPGWVRRRT